MTARDGIRSVTVDGTTVTADSITDEIALDKYQRELDAQQTTSVGAGLGLYFRKMNPPGGGG